MEKFRIRTDLALEEKESFEGTDVEITGVVLTEDYKEETDILVTKVEIVNENGAKAMRKPMGNYITLEAKNLQVSDDDYHKEVSKELAKYIADLMPSLSDLSNEKENMTVLVVGLGNRDVTPDSLGPRAISNLQITRHLIKEFGVDADGKEGGLRISAVVPGVMAQTGMETSEMVKGIIDEIQADYVIAIDALAARSSHRLNTTIQLTDTGINPGSGVGNHRCGITEETLGVPVIAIGIPTVVDAATIVNDTMDSLIDFLGAQESLQAISGVLKEFNDGEKYELIRELLEPSIGTMFVTPKDIDETIKMLSFTISEALNMALAQ